jgi:putative ABC transport system permease protein
MLRQAVVVTMIGLAAGIPLTIAGSKAVSSLVYGVDPMDPVSLAAAALVISVVAGLAAYLPARRAARLEPLSALRLE